MISMLLCSLVLALAMGWMLRVNAADRQRFERELAEDSGDEPDDC